MTPDLSEDRLLGGRVVLRQPRERSEEHTTTLP